MKPWSNEDALRTCEGFEALGPAGRCGTVEAVVYESRHDRPDRLLVRSRRWGPLATVQIADVVRVDAELRTVVLCSAEAPARRPPRLLAAAAVATVGIALIVAGVLFQRGGAPRAGAVVARAPFQAAAVVPSAAAPQHAATLAVVARRGDCWILLRRGGASGRVIGELLLTAGRRLAVRLDRPVWARIGNPPALDVYVAGRLVRSLPRFAANMTFTRAGMRPAG